MSEKEVAQFGSSPESVLRLALEAYRSRGGSYRLAAAAASLDGFGAPAWPVLRAFFLTNPPEAESFIHLIDRVGSGAPFDERFSVLSTLLNHGDSDVRSKAYDYLYEMTGGALVLTAAFVPSGPDGGMRR